MLSRGEMSSTCEIIPRDDVRLHPHSFADPDGRLFEWNGQLYRGISFDQAPFFSRLFREGIIEALVDRDLLIDSHLTTLSIEGYAAVVRHKHVPFTSYPQEWCAAMLKDAALTIINLVIELANRDLTLKDAHPWNLLFDACKPVYVDLTSIVPLTGDTSWPAYEEFCHFCLYPLILMAHGHERIARSLLPEHGGVQSRELAPLARGSVRSAFTLSELVRKGLKPVGSLFRKGERSANARSSFLNRIRKEIESISMPLYKSGGAQDNGVLIAQTTTCDDWTERQKVLQRIFSEVRPGSVLDLSGSGGAYSRLAASTGSRVVSLDTDLASVTRLYYEARDRGWSILPLIVDFMKPTPSVGYSSHYLIAATDRLKCEMVLALALVRRAVFEHSLTLDLIVEGLALFSTRWVVVEFAQPADLLSGKERADRPSWYTLDNLIGALRKRFRSVSITASGLAPHVLLLCEK
jgi:hypothetical protein